MCKYEDTKRRICLLHHASGLGGGTKSFIDLAMMLKDSYEVIACIPKGESPLKQLLISKEICIYEIGVPYPQLPRYSGGPNLISRTMVRYIWNWRYIKKFCVEMEALKPDILIFNSIVTVIVAPFLSKTIKKVCFVRETIVDKDACVIFKKILKCYFQGACFLSQYDQKMLADDTLSSIVIPDSVPKEDIVLELKENARKKEGLPYDKFLVLYMGGDDRIKGADTILEAFRRLVDNKQLILAGSFFEEETSVKLWNIKEIIYKIQLKKKYRELMKDGKVVLVGMRKDISTIMNACDIVVFPSTKVHQARPCIEAGFYHKPVIISDYEQTKEYFINEYNALTFKSKQAKDLRKKICYAYENPNQMKKMGERNYEMSIKFHNYEKIQKELQKYIISHLE